MEFGTTTVMSAPEAFLEPNLQQELLEAHAACVRAESMMHLALRQPLRAHVQRARMRHHRDGLIGLGRTYWRFEVYRASDVPQRASEITRPRG